MKVLQGKRYEDYLKVIYRLTLDKKVVRLKDIVKELNVKPSTALQYITKLEDMGLVRYSQGIVELTASGHSYAKDLTEKYEIIKEFMERVLGVESSKASEISCLIEHIVDDKVLSKMKRVMEKWEECD